MLLRKPLAARQHSNGDINHIFRRGQFIDHPALARLFGDECLAGENNIQGFYETHQAWQTPASPALMSLPLIALKVR